MNATALDDRIDELLAIRLTRRFTRAEHEEYCHLTAMRLRQGGEARR